MRKIIFFITIIAIVVAGCRKNKKECIGDKFQIQPFLERFGKFSCGNNDEEYTYIFSKKVQIDSLSPNCSYRQIAFPLEETDMRYIIMGKISYHIKDTFQTMIFKDTCLKTLTYEVNMIQRDTTKVSFYPLGATISMFCSVENVPSDYEVEVKYKYVPLE
jgi:hypothetical protein